MALLLSWNWFVSGDESNMTVILPLTQFVEGYLIFFPGPEIAKKGMRGGQVVMLFRDVP